MVYVYTTFLNHGQNFLHFAVGFIFLFVIVPVLITKKDNDTDADVLGIFFKNYIKMVFILIVLGYSLVVLKLFELLTFIFIFIFLTLWKYIKKNPSASWRDLLHDLLTLIYAYTDGLIKPKHKIINFFLLLKRKGQLFYELYLHGIYNLSRTMLLVTVFSFIIYIRFYDAYIHAAPAMSDAYVTLAWMKYIINRILFHDGIYPQGFHIYLALLQKFSAIDPLYVLRYTGPLNAVLTSLTLYFAASRLTGNFYAGITAALTYGVFGQYMAVDWARQASTNSQEFSFIFIMPAIYYAISYINTGKKRELYTAGFAAFVAGLVHTLGYITVGVGFGAVVFTAVITNFKENIKRVLNICLMGLLSIMIALAPAVVGFLLGKEFHQSSSEYALSKAINISFPELYIIDYVSLTSIFLIILYSFYLLFFKKNRKEGFSLLSIVIFTISVFLIYYFGGALLNSSVIASRSGDLWYIVLPLCVGVGWHIVTNVISILRNKKLEVLICITAIAVLVFFFKPEPIIPYKMEYDSNVEQYIRISEEFRPSEWLIVSQNEGYALAYGKGYHLMLREFLDSYEPSERKLSRKVGSNIEILDVPHVFIYQEKKVFRTGFENLQSMYDAREKDYEDLTKWVKEYERYHDNISIYYEDEYIKIFYIHQPPDKKESFESLWV